MPTTQYKPFGTGTSPAANTLTYSAYNATATLIDAGYVAGIADAQHINTVLRQATVGVAGTAKFATDNGVLDCLDDGSPTNFALALKSAVDAIVKLSCPPGKFGEFGMPTAPTGWLECNGAAVSRSSYAALFAAIGTTWGAGDGSTTFNLPDARGYALRGWDHGSGVDAGRAFGSTQQDAFQTHQHEFLGDDQAGTVGYTLVNNLHTGFNQDNVNGGDYLTKSDPSNPGATETRMKNIAVLVCIKT